MTEQDQEPEISEAKIIPLTDLQRDQVQENEGLVWMVLRRMMSGFKNYHNDLYPAGIEALIRAVQTYDPNRVPPVRLSTYATSCIYRATRQASYELCYPLGLKATTVEREFSRSGSDLNPKLKAVIQPGSMTELEEQAEAGLVGPLEYLIERERLEIQRTLYHQILASLEGYRYKDEFQMHMIEGMPIEDVALLKGVSRVTANHRVLTTLRILRKQFLGKEVS